MKADSASGELFLHSEEGVITGGGLCVKETEVIVAMMQYFDTRGVCQRGP